MIINSLINNYNNWYIFILIMIWPARCSGLLEWTCPGLMGLPAELLSSSRLWSARHSSSSSRRENSSPGSNCLLHTEHRKHSMWYTLSRALITKSLLLNPRLHFAHLIPNSLENWKLIEKLKMLNGTFNEKMCQMWVVWLFSFLYCY